MLDSRFNNALKLVCISLTENDIPFAVIGSVNMRLQGMDVQPADLDIVVRLKDLAKMHEIFSAYAPSPVRELQSLGHFPAWEVKVVIGAVDVQILGEQDAGEYVSKLLEKRLISIRWDDVQIPCFTLEAEAQAYAETKREHKARRILEFLKEKSRL